MTRNVLSCCLIWYLFWRPLSIIKSLMRRGSLTSVAECFPWQESVLSDDFRCICLFSSEMIWQRSTNPANYRHTASQSRLCIQPSIIDSQCVLMCGVKTYVKIIFCNTFQVASSRNSQVVCSNWVCLTIAFPNWGALAHTFPMKSSFEGGIPVYPNFRQNQFILGSQMFSAPKV